MKIGGPGRIQSGSVKKGASKSKADGAAFAKELSAGEGVDETQGAHGNAPVSAVSALIGLQEVPSATDHKSKGLAQTVAQGHDMLDMLEEVRKGILLGAIPEKRLRELADMARGRKNQADQDPRLNELLSDIELRAEVELAKLGF